MNAKVGIGITTYEDIRAAAFGHAFYETLVAGAPKLAPDRIEVLYNRFEVENAQDFASHWCTETRHVLHSKHGVTPSYTPPSDYGASWRTRGSLTGHGQVFFGGRDPNAPATLTLEHRFTPRVPWKEIFRRLVHIFKPAHANIHVFTERELELAGDGCFAFRGPICGEAAFTAWNSPLGTIRGPDPWEIAERRRYRFLPELAWGNYLGNQFSGSYNREKLLGISNTSKELNEGVLFHVTDDLRDVVRRSDFFERERKELHKAFPSEFFRSN